MKVRAASASLVILICSKVTPEVLKLSEEANFQMDKFHNPNKQINETLLGFLKILFVSNSIS